MANWAYAIAPNTLKSRYQTAHFQTTAVPIHVTSHTLGTYITLTHAAPDGMYNGYIMSW